MTGFDAKPEVTVERMNQLRQEAMEKLTVYWDPVYPEVCINFDGVPLVMIRSLKFGSPEDSIEWAPDKPGPDWRDERRFTLYSWDNDDTNGEWTGNMGIGDPLWGSSISWPPPDPDEEAVDGLRRIIADNDDDT